MSYPLAAPVEAKPVVLAIQHRMGKVPVHLTSTAKFKLESGSGKQLSWLQNIDTRLNENTVNVLPGGARVLLGIDKFAVGVSLNNEPPAMSAQFKKAIGKDIGALVIELQVDRGGNIVKTTNQLGGVPADSREIVGDMGEQIQSSFDTVAIPLPGGMTQPGKSWTAKRTVPIDLPGSSQTAVMDMTYTYRGVRQHEGRQVAVLELRGTLLSARVPGARDPGARDLSTTLRGRTTGTAIVDPATGTVLHAKATAEASLVVKYRDESFQARGTLEVTMRRGSEVK
jgi:hypothetical protein